MTLDQVPAGTRVLVDCNILVYHFQPQHGLLTNDALILALMEQHSLTHLASHDSDFDRVSGITRYSPA